MSTTSLSKGRMEVPEFLAWSSGGGIATGIASDGDIALAPPGISVAVAALLGPAGTEEAG